MLSFMLDTNAAKANVERILELARQIGAQRFEAEGMVAHAAILALAGRKSEALAMTLRGLDAARKTGIQFLGPDLLGQLAILLTEDDALRCRSLAEGEELLRAGSVGHNHLRFHRHAIEASLKARAWDEVDRYTQALEGAIRDWNPCRGPTSGLTGAGCWPRMAAIRPVVRQSTPSEMS